MFVKPGGWIRVWWNSKERYESYDYSASFDLIWQHLALSRRQNGAFLKEWQWSCFAFKFSAKNIAYFQSNLFFFTFCELIFTKLDFFDILRQRSIQPSPSWTCGTISATTTRPRSSAPWASPTTWGFWTKSGRLRLWVIKDDGSGKWSKPAPAQVNRKKRQSSQLKRSKIVDSL